MSKVNSRTDVQITDLQNKKQRGEKIVAITCYDSAFAKIINKTAIDLILVGDSLGNVMMGYTNTIPVTLDDMLRYSASVSRVITRSFTAVDMPFFTYRLSVEEALRNAARLIQEGGTQAVKLEGGKSITSQVSALSLAGIPVIGHIGLTPQSIHAFGGYKVQGRGKQGGQLLEDALALEEAGASLLVLELIPYELAGKITAGLKIPTIGIGAGPYCDGQILVLHDMLGMDPTFQPKFLRQFAQLSDTVQNALEAYVSETRMGNFPSLEHSYGDS